MVMRGREVRRLGIVDITDPASITNAAAAGRSLRESTPATDKPAGPERPPVIDVRRAPRSPAHRSSAANRAACPGNSPSWNALPASPPSTPTWSRIDDETFSAFCDTFGGSHPATAYGCSPTPGFVATPPS